MRAFKTFWRAIRDVYEELMLLVGVSVLWWLATLLIIPGPAATAGLSYLAHRIVHEQRVDFSFFWQEAKTRFGKGWQLAAFNLVTLVMLLANVVFYSQMSNFLRYITFAWVYLLLLWVGMQLHLFPLVFEVEGSRLLLVLRNAVLMPLVRPGYTLLLMVLVLVATIICIILPFLLIAVWPALLALIGARATLSTIEEIAERQAKQSPPEA